MLIVVTLVASSVLEMSLHLKVQVSGSLVDSNYSTEQWP